MWETSFSIVKMINVAPKTITKKIVGSCEWGETEESWYFFDRV